MNIIWSSVSYMYGTAMIFVSLALALPLTHNRKDYIHGDINFIPSEDFNWDHS